MSDINTGDLLKELLPTIRDVVPSLIAEDLAGVQPMSDPGLAKMDFTHKEIRSCFGGLIHRFGEGWLMYDGTDYIYPEEFVKKFPDLNYEYLTSMQGMHASYSNYKRFVDEKED